MGTPKGTVPWNAGTSQGDGTRIVRDAHISVTTGLPYLMCQYLAEQRRAAIRGVKGGN